VTLSVSLGETWDSGWINGPARESGAFFLERALLAAKIRLVAF
jgi:hypothetical protein